MGEECVQVQVVEMGVSEMLEEYEFFTEELKEEGGYRFVRERRRRKRKTQGETDTHTRQEQEAGEEEIIETETLYLHKYRAILTSTSHIKVRRLLRALNIHPDTPTDTHTHTRHLRELFAREAEEERTIEEKDLAMGVRDYINTHTDTGTGTDTDTQTQVVESVELTFEKSLYIPPYVADVFVDDDPLVPHLVSVCVCVCVCGWVDGWMGRRMCDESRRKDLCSHTHDTYTHTHTHTHRVTSPCA
jgi:hypothetical protein